VPIEPAEIIWNTSPEAEADIMSVRAALGENEYRNSVRALRKFLCAYVDSNNGCTKAQGPQYSSHWS